MQALAAAGALGDVARFAARLTRVPWFAAVGQPLVEGEVADAASWAVALDLGAPSIAAVEDWIEAAALARTPVDGLDWWAREDDERRALLAVAGTRHGERPLLEALSRATLAASDVAMGAASVAAAREGLADPALARVAAGAAAQAATHAALALAAGAGDRHAFAAKFRLLEAGRWPLGIVDGRLRVF